MGEGLGFVEDVFPVVAADVIRAKDFLAANPGVSARDTVHTAVK